MSAARPPILTLRSSFTQDAEGVSEGIRQDLLSSLAEAADIAVAAILRGRIPLDATQWENADRITAMLSLSSSAGDMSGFVLTLRLHPLKPQVFTSLLRDKTPPPEMRLIQNAVIPAVEIFRAANTDPGLAVFEYSAGVADMSAHQKMALLERHPSPLDTRARRAGRSQQ